MKKKKALLLSVVIPVYNERRTIEQILNRVLAVQMKKEVIVVDDGSSDGTADVLAKLRRKRKFDLIRHDVNRGKGMAVQSGLSRVKGDVVVIQDADLEYHPEDYPKALALIEDGWADAVYGSRFLGPHRVFLFWHYVGNKILTLLCNMITSGMLTDMETGFKLIRANVLKTMDIRSETFDFEVEITVKLFRYGYRVYEIPITYTGRGYEEGKKITWRDGIRAFGALAKWGISVRSKKQGHVSGGAVR